MYSSQQGKRTIWVVSVVFYFIIAKRASDPMNRRLDGWTDGRTNPPTNQRPFVEEIIHGHTDNLAKKPNSIIILGEHHSHCMSVCGRLGKSSLLASSFTERSSDLRGDSIGQLSYRRRYRLLRISNLISNKSNQHLS